MPTVRNCPFPPGACLRFFLVYAALYVPYSIITPYFQQMLAMLRFSNAQIGYIQGALELMAVLSPVLWGVLTDRLGSSRGVLALTVALCLPSFLLFPLCGGGTVAAVCAALLFGLFFKPSIPLTDGMTFRYINQAGGNYGAVRIGGTSGYLVFIALFDVVFTLAGGVTVAGIAWLFAAAVAVQLASLLIVPTTPGAAAPETPETPETPTAGVGWRAFAGRLFLTVVAVAFLGRVAMMSYYSFFSRYLSEAYGIERVGWIWALGSICEVPLVYNSRRIMGRIGVKGLLTLGMLGIVVRLAGFGLRGGLWLVLLMQPLHMFTFGAYHCSTLEYVARLFPARLQGSAQGVFSAVTIGLGGLIGSAAGGVVIDHFGYRALYVGYSLVALAGLLLCLVALPNVNEENERSRA